MDRIAKLRKFAFEGVGLDGYIIFNGVNQLYFLGFPGTSALLVPAEGECTVFVGGVNYEQAKAMSNGVKVDKIDFGENLMKKIASKATDQRIRALAVDSLAVQSWKALTNAFRGQAKLKADGSHIAALRMVKDKEEIALMRKASEITGEGMKAAYDAIKLGVKEVEIAAEIEYAMRRKGSGPTAFESIVASGACSAFPHGGCSDREIRDGDLVVVDIGATYQHYCSDMTRTLVAGKPTQKQRRIHQIVLAAQQRAFEAIKAGAEMDVVDAAARCLIADAGFGDFFVHRLGHGVGLEVHETPSMGPGVKDKLAKDCVVTDEPGIYIPGFGGVRIEDTMLVQKDGAEKLTIGPYGFAKE